MVLSLSATAQNVVPVGIVNGHVHVVQTTLYINIKIERQITVAGPYARYALKYLSVSAPLADKVVFEIKSATIATQKATEDKVWPKSPESKALHMLPSEGFPKLLIDRMSNSELSLEENARLAALRIFDIRKSRYELITGEAGENVFGAGLKAALAELDKLEEEYLSLFLGKYSSQTTSKEYSVVPSADKDNYIVCRFSPTDGLVAVDELSGQPIVLETSPLKNITEKNLAAVGLTLVVEPAKNSQAYRVADDVVCRVVSGSTLIASETIPIYQFGRTLYLK